MIGIASDKEIADTPPKPEVELPELDALLSDIEGIRTMPFAGVVPDIEKYADLPELKNRYAAQPVRRGLMFSVMQKIKKIFS